MEKFKDLHDQYFDQIITWHDGLERLYQYGVLFLLIVIGLLVVTFFILSRFTGESYADDNESEQRNEIPISTRDGEAYTN